MSFIIYSGRIFHPNQCWDLRQTVTKQSSKGTLIEPPTRLGRARQDTSLEPWQWIVVRKETSHGHFWCESPNAFAEHVGRNPWRLVPGGVKYVYPQNASEWPIVHFSPHKWHLAKVDNISSNARKSALKGFGYKFQTVYYRRERSQLPRTAGLY